MGVFTDDVRRRDVPPPKWFAKDTQTTIVHADPADTRPQQILQTEQGNITLGIGGDTMLGWMPSVGILEEAPYIDTRRTGISDRYYR